MLFVFAFVSLRAAPAFADEPDPDRRAEARVLYDAGSRRYALGEYTEAIELFRKAYDLTGAPELLFDIAQANRLAGRCSRALETYRHFVRLLPDSVHRQDADARIAELGQRCGTAPPVSAPSPGVAASTPITASTPTAAAPEARPTGRPLLKWALLGSGVAAGLVAGGLYLWNDGRHEIWSAEDRRLAGALGSGETPEARVALQNDNDARLRSIHTADAFTVGFAAVGAAALLGAGVVALWPGASAPSVALHPRGVQLAWTLRLP